MFNNIKCEEFLSTNFFKIEWILSTMCNYRCSYCFLKEKGTEILDSAVLKKIANNIKILKTPINYFKFSGGEISIMNDFIDLYNICYENNNILKLGLSSNGSFSNDYIKNLIINKSNKKIRFDLSMHIEYCELTHFISNIDILVDNGIFAEILVMSHDKYYNKIIDTYNILCKRYKYDNNVAIKVKGIDYFDNVQHYNKEYIEFIRSASYNEHNAKDNYLYCDNEIMTVEDFKLHNYHKHLQGMKCKVYNYWRILPTGHIVPRCYNLGGANIIKTFHMLNINDVSKIDSMINGYFICKWDSCNCPGNIRLYKWRD